MQCPNEGCDSSGWPPVRLATPGIRKCTDGTTVVVTTVTECECALCKTRWCTESVDICRNVTIPDTQAAKV